MGITLTPRLTLALLTDGAEVGMIVHPGLECLGHLQILSGGRHLAYNGG